MEFPITVTGIEFEKSELIEPGLRKAGSFVKIRPCGDEYGNKTYLGVLLGDMLMNQKVKFNKETGVLQVGRSFGNPAIYVFALKKVIFGCESFWGVLDNPEQLADITDDTIDNIWYVKLIRQHLEQESAKSDDPEAALQKTAEELAKGMGAVDSVEEVGEGNADGGVEPE